MIGWGEGNGHGCGSEDCRNAGQMVLLSEGSNCPSPLVSTGMWSREKESAFHPGQAAQTAVTAN